MEKLIFTFLLLTILTVLGCWQSFKIPFTSRNNKFVTPIFILVKNWFVSTKKQLTLPYSTENQYEFYISPIQFHFCPILQNTSKSTFA